MMLTFWLKQMVAARFEKAGEFWLLEARGVSGRGSKGRNRARKMSYPDAKV